MQPRLHLCLSQSNPFTSHPLQISKEGKRTYVDGFLCFSGKQSGDQTELGEEDEGADTGENPLHARSAQRQAAHHVQTSTQDVQPQPS